MEFVDFKGKDYDLGNPPDWEDADGVTCRPLPIKHEAIGPYRAKVSYWKPSEDELKRLVAGECVRLVCLGPMSPTMLEVERVEITDASQG